jgi:hypothetical protein
MIIVMMLSVGLEFNNNRTKCVIGVDRERSINSDRKQTILTQPRT